MPMVAALLLKIAYYLPSPPHIHRPPTPLVPRPPFTLIALVTLAAAGYLTYSVYGPTTVTSSTLIDTQTTIQADANIWGISHLAEIAGAAHDALSDAKLSLLAFEPDDFATPQGPDTVLSCKSLDAMSFDVVMALDKLTQTIRHELNLWVISLFIIIISQ